MSEPEPTPSLIQQRLALQRGMNEAVWACASPLVGASVFVSLIVGDTAGWLPWLALALALTIAGAVYGVWRFRSARRAIREFEDRYGPDAGKQD